MQDAVLAIVYNKDKTQVVLVKRKDVPVWVLPGGGIDPGETPEEAVMREVLEETGLVVEVVRQTGEYTPINKLTSFTRLYECKILEGNIQRTDETSAIQLYELDELPRSFLIVHRDWLEDALKNLPYPIKKAITRVTYWGIFKYLLCHPILVLRALLARIGLPLNSR